MVEPGLEPRLSALESLFLTIRQSCLSVYVYAFLGEFSEDVVVKWHLFSSFFLCLKKTILVFPIIANSIIKKLGKYRRR